MSSSLKSTANGDFILNNKKGIGDKDMKKNDFKKLMVLGITGGVALASHGAAFADQTAGQEGTYLAAGCSGSTGKGCSHYRSGSPRDTTTAYETPAQSGCSARSQVATGMDNSSFPSNMQSSGDMNPVNNPNTSGTVYSQNPANANSNQAQQQQWQNSQQQMPNGMNSQQGQNPYNNGR